jgi:hypothetical protein
MQITKLINNNQVTSYDHIKNSKKTPFNDFDADIKFSNKE